MQGNSRDERRGAQPARCLAVAIGLTAILWGVAAVWPARSRPGSRPTRTRPLVQLCLGALALAAWPGRWLQAMAGVADAWRGTPGATCTAACADWRWPPRGGARERRRGTGPGRHRRAPFRSPGRPAVPGCRSPSGPRGRPTRGSTPSSYAAATRCGRSPHATFPPDAEPASLCPLACRSTAATAASSAPTPTSSTPASCCACRQPPPLKEPAMTIPPSRRPVPRRSRSPPCRARSRST